MTRQRLRLKIVSEGRAAYFKSRAQEELERSLEEAREEDEQAERDQDALDAYDDMVRRDIERRADLDKQLWLDWKWAALAAGILFFLFYCLFYYMFFLWRPPCPIP